MAISSGGGGSDASSGCAEIQRATGGLEQAEVNLDEKVTVPYTMYIRASVRKGRVQQLLYDAPQ